MFVLEVIVVNLGEIFVRPIHPFEERRYQKMMQEHHYLGSLPTISETLWYIALWGDQWVALLSFSASALKCAARDSWIGWNFRHQYNRLRLIVNNSRFLILPDWHIPNLGSRILSLCFWFQDRKQPDFVQYTPPDHGRIEIRKIWTTSELNGYLNFPHVVANAVIKVNDRPSHTEI